MTDLGTFRKPRRIISPNARDAIIGGLFVAVMAFLGAAMMPAASPMTQEICK